MVDIPTTCGALLVGALVAMLCVPLNPRLVDMLICHTQLIGNSVCPSCRIFQDVRQRCTVIEGAGALNFASVANSNNLF
jgi:hypothetical protein